MQLKSTNAVNPVADRLRPVVYLYAALNIAVAAILFTTVSPTLVIEPVQEMASLP